MWHVTVNRSVGRVVWCMLCGLRLPSQQYFGSTALLLACVRKGERSNKQAFLMQAQPSAKSSFCLGTDSTAISQSLLNPFLLAVVWQLLQALLRTTCKPETEKRAFFIHISFILLYVCVCTYLIIFCGRICT